MGKAAEKRKTLDRSIAEVQHRQAAIHEEHRAFVDYIERVENCRKCQYPRRVPGALRLLPVNEIGEATSQAVGPLGHTVGRCALHDGLAVSCYRRAMSSLISSGRDARPLPDMLRAA
jgi:hypothetical protein